MKKVSEYRPSIILANMARQLNSRYNEMVGGEYTPSLEEHVRYIDIENEANVQQEKFESGKIYRVEITSSDSSVFSASSFSGGYTSSVTSSVQSLKPPVKPQFIYGVQ